MSENNLKPDLNPTSDLNFSTALFNAISNGRRIARLSWPPDTFVVVMPELRIPSFNTADTHKKVNDRTAKWIGNDTPLNCKPYLAIYGTHDDPQSGNWQPGWLPSTDDIFATDWAYYLD